MTSPVEQFAGEGGLASAHLLTTVLNRADAGIPKRGLEHWNSNLIRDAKIKDLKPKTVLKTIQQIATDFGTDKADSQILLEKFADMYQTAVEGFDFQYYDKVLHGELDDFLSHTPEQLQIALAGKQNASALLHLFLDTGKTTLQLAVTETTKDYPNYYLTEMTRSLGHLTSYLQGGGFEEAIEKQRLLTACAERTQKENFKYKPLSIFFNLLTTVKSASETFDNRGAALRNFDDLLLIVYDSQSKSITQLKPESITALAKSAVDLRGGNEGDGLALVREAGQIFAALDKDDIYATHIFCQAAFKSLETAGNSANYDKSQALLSLQKSADFLRKANGNQTQDTEAYGLMRSFLAEGYMQRLLDLPQENFVDEVIDSVNGTGNAKKKNSEGYEWT